MMTDIRVGLEAMYKNKSSIMVYNSRIALGFCLNNSYSAQLELDSDTGFSLIPDKNTYYTDGIAYSSYSKAVSVCKLYESGGATAFPVLAGTGSWLCYVTAASYNSFATGELKDRAEVFQKRAPSAYLIKMTGQDISLLIDGEKAGGFPQIKALNPTNGIYSVNLGSRSYRGRIEIGRYGGSSALSAVNIINIESYLLGVVTCEMDHTWPIEALKAQAVCSRSYAFMKSSFGADSRLNNPYTIVDTTASQVYKGVGGETSESYEAVSSTVGRIVTSKGKPIDAFYFSTSGGATDAIMDIWGVKSSAYSGVFDFFEREPEKKPWSYDFTVGEVTGKLAAAGYNVGTVIAIEPFILTESGRIYRARIRGSSKDVIISGSRLKSIFSLPDTKCRVITSDSDDSVFVKSDTGISRIGLKGMYCITSSGTFSASDTAKQYILITDGNLFNVPAELPSNGSFRFIGMGWGHGVGMSQSGAKGMAKAGYNYSQIIEFYYNNAEVGTYYE